MGIRHILLLFVVSAFGVTSALANNEIIHTYRSLRSYSLGGTWVTTGEYADALFGNPARHASVDEGKFSLMDLTLEFNPQLITSISDVGKVKGSGAEVVSTIAPLVGKNLHGRVALLIAGYSAEFFDEHLAFAAGLLANAQVNLFPHFDTSVDSQTYIDIGPHVGMAYRLLDGALSVGINMHLSYRISVDRRIIALELIGGGNKLSLKTLGSEGLGADTDIGAYYKLPLEWSIARLSVGLSLNNLLQSTYSLANPRLVAKEAGEHPPRNARTVNTGIRADFPDVWVLKQNMFAVEFTDLGSHTYRSSLGKKVHFGGETRPLKWLHVRFGVNQGYPGGGVGFVLPVFRADIATWGEELGTTAGMMQDRRVGLRLAAEI
jgi:hypothetical protein